MTTPELLHILRTNIDLLETLASAGAPPIAAGDLAQIRPDADDTFGGTLFRATAVTNHHRVRGYLLTAHRGACREAWLSFPPSSLQRIGPVPFEESTWSLRTFERAAQAIPRKAAASEVRLPAVREA